jgi:hypothetical protein
MTTPATGTSAAADVFSAVTALLARARAGGIRDELRAALSLGETQQQVAAAYEQHARYLQETGQYPAHVWEPWLVAAAQARAAGMALGESGSAISAIMRTPAGELAGVAPHRDELNVA